MFDLDYDNGSYVFGKTIDQWSSEKAINFINVFESIFPNSKHAEEVALSIASNVWSGEDSSLLDHYGLSDTDALCYLNLITNKYQKDIKEAYMSYAADQVDC